MISFRGYWMEVDYVIHMFIPAKKIFRVYVDHDSDGDRLVIVLTVSINPYLK